MKLVNDVLSAAKGKDNVDSILTGKGAFSQTGFGDVVNSMANDTTFGVKTYDKDGKVSGTVNISELIRGDLKKTLEKAKYPQQSEKTVLDSCEIVTAGLAKAIPYIVEEQIKCGKKFDLPQQPTFGGSIYLADVKGGTKDHVVRDINTKEEIGISTITSKDSVKIATKSPVPKFLQTKVRKDMNGKVIG